MLDYIGMERLVLKSTRPRSKRLILHQCEYVESVVREYEVNFHGGRTLRSVSTPAKTRESPDDPIPNDVPDLSKAAPHMVMQMYWAARCTRPDFVSTCKRLSGRFTKWARIDDAILHRLFQYARGHINYGIEISGCYDDVASLIIRGFADADHLGGPATTKGTNGHYVEVKGEHTKIPSTWGAKPQAGSTRNTPESELVPLDFMMHEAALPLILLWNRLLSRDVKIRAREDNTTAKTIVEKGYSRKLGYLMAKADKVAVSSLHEIFVGDPDDLEASSIHSLEHLGTKEQVADMFTKPLEHDDHWRFSREAGLVQIPVELLRK